MADNNKKHPARTAGMIFGVFMVIIYIGMAILMFVDFFKFQWEWARYMLAIVFLLYGIWRAYRQFNPKFHENDND